MSSSPPHSADLEIAHKHSIYHRKEILSSELCGCFYCGKTFPPAEIEDWTDEQEGLGTTAMCPRCGIDSVVGSASGFPLTPEFLQQMHEVLASQFGELLPCGRIVRFRDPNTNFEEACASGAMRANDYFSEFIAGLRVGNVDALRKLGFFDQISDRLHLRPSNIRIRSSLWGPRPTIRKSNTDG